MMLKNVKLYQLPPKGEEDALFYIDGQAVDQRQFMKLAVERVNYDELRIVYFPAPGERETFCGIGRIHRLWLQEDLLYGDVETYDTEWGNAFCADMDAGKPIRSYVAIKRTNYLRSIDVQDSIFMIEVEMDRDRYENLVTMSLLHN